MDAGDSLLWQGMCGVRLETPPRSLIGECDEQYRFRNFWQLLMLIHTLHTECDPGLN